MHTDYSFTLMIKTTGSRLPKVKRKRGARKNKEIHKRSDFSQWEKISKDQDSFYISHEMIHKQVGNGEYKR